MSKPCAPLTNPLPTFLTHSFPDARRLPYPSVGAWDGHKLQPDAPPLEARPALAAVFANGHHADGRLVGRSVLRDRLLAECAAAPRDECLMMESMARKAASTPSSPGSVQSRGSSGLNSFKDPNASSNAAGTVVRAYQSAKFCLQPWGDLATRKAYWDALAAGCINAVFTESGWNETDAWYGDHREWTVHIPIEEVGTSGRGALAYLRAIPTEEVRRLHTNAVRARAWVQYGFSSGGGHAARIEQPTPGGDAVHGLVEGLARHFAEYTQATRGATRVPVSTPLRRLVCGDLSGFGINQTLRRDVSRENKT